MGFWAVPRKGLLAVSNGTNFDPALQRRSMIASRCILYSLNGPGDLVLNILTIFTISRERWYLGFNYSGKLSQVSQQNHGYCECAERPLVILAGSSRNSFRCVEERRVTMNEAKLSVIGMDQMTSLFWRDPCTKFVATCRPIYDPQYHGLWESQATVAFKMEGVWSYHLGRSPISRFRRSTQQKAMATGTGTGWLPVMLANSSLFDDGAVINSR